MRLQVLQRPHWHGTPIELGDLFRLHKNCREAGATLFTHQLGWEVRLLVGAQVEVVQTQVCRDLEEVLATRAVEASDDREGVAVTIRPMFWLLLAIFVAPSNLLFAQGTEWTLVNASSSYSMEASGDVLRTEGATVLVRSIRPTTLPSRAVTTLNAEPLRHRRVTVTGHVETQAVKGATWLLAEVERIRGDLMVFNTFAQRLQGDNTPTPLTFTFPVPSDATAIVVGLALRGDGSARANQLSVGEPFDVNRPVPPEVETLLNAAIKIVQTEALNRHLMDWKTVTQEMRMLAADTGNTAGAYTAIRYLLGSMLDGHSVFLAPADAKVTAAGSADNPPVEVMALEHGIGYVSLPGYVGGAPRAAQAHVSRAYQQLSVISPDAPCGRVLDLRANSGGNVWPMVATLRPFLGEEPMDQKIDVQPATDLGRRSEQRPGGGDHWPTNGERGRRCCAAFSRPSAQSHFRATECRSDHRESAVSLTGWFRTGHCGGAHERSHRAQLQWPD